MFTDLSRIPSAAALAVSLLSLARGAVWEPVLATLGAADQVGWAEVFKQAGDSATVSLG